MKTEPNQSAYPRQFDPQTMDSPNTAGKGAWNNDDIQQVCGGLTKREAFAMAAMQGILSNSVSFYADNPQETARLAVIAADALIEALNK